MKDQYIVDTGYIVAFEDTLQYNVTILPGLRAGGKLKSFFFGGEGLVCRFSGQGQGLDPDAARSIVPLLGPSFPTHEEQLSNTADGRRRTRESANPEMPQGRDDFLILAERIR